MDNRVWVLRHLLLPPKGHFPSLLPCSRLGWWFRLIQFHSSRTCCGHDSWAHPRPRLHFLSSISLVIPEDKGCSVSPIGIFFFFTVINQSQTFKQNKFSPCTQNRLACVTVSPWNLALECCVPYSRMDGLYSPTLNTFVPRFPYQSFPGPPCSLSCRDLAFLLLAFLLKAKEGAEDISLPCFTPWFWWRKTSSSFVRKDSWRRVWHLRDMVCLHSTLTWLRLG